jgi:putative sigma-54 modulation protein
MGNMQTSITFKNIDPSDNLRAYVSDKLDRFDKFLDNPAEANVVLSVEKFRHIAEINISGDRMNINGKEETNDMYSAIDMTLDKLETQIKKTKETIKTRRGGAGLKAKEIIDGDSDFLDEEADEQIRIKNIDYKPMDIDEAIMQMDLVSNNFLVFTNARTDQVNVIYRRKNGQYGLIQPSS